MGQEKLNFSSGVGYPGLLNLVTWLSILDNHSWRYMRKFNRELTTRKTRKKGFLTNILNLADYEISYI